MSTPTPNDLGHVITSDRVRRIIYSTYVIGIVLLGAVQVAYAGMLGGNPAWLDIANAVALYLGAPVGALAVANVKRGKYAE